jgi:hypothetical protein
MDVCGAHNEDYHFRRDANLLAEINFHCPQGESGGQMSLHYDGENLAIVEEHGASSLTGTIQGDVNGRFTLYGTGPMDAIMPNAAALDLCLIDKLQEQAVLATDVDAVAYATNSCRLKLTPAGSMLRVQTQLTLTSIDKGKAMLFIQRKYKMPSVVTGKPLQLDELPIRNCNVLSEP